MTENARIKSTFLGYEDHGIFTATLTLEFDGTEQGALGYCLDTYDKGRNDPLVRERRGTAFGMDHILQVLAVVGVRSWSELVGKHIRVERADRHTIVRIGHLVKDQWLDPHEHARRPEWHTED